ncbi:hypothetical protein P691DRAFT_692196, partial [Macrolepiota fuliginosa MF-IS2]
MLASPWFLEKPSTYLRPLGLTEQVFYWDGLFAGTADSVVSAEVEVQHDHEISVFSAANIERAWLSLKHQFPLLGSQVIQRPDQSLWFSVDETRLRTLGPGEVYFHDIASAEEAQAVSSNIPNSPRLLSNHLLACLFVLRRTDNSKRLHVLIHASHMITDGNANATLLRTFLDKLASPRSDIGSWDLRKQLVLSSSCDDLSPVHRLSIARRQWRRAIGTVINSNRMSKLPGGHTLPCKVTNLTPHTPARSGNVVVVFTKEETQGILQGCRQFGVTFGVAYPVLGQVALARTLCRKYIQGEISEAEWEFRKREPMRTAGPLNLRPFLDREWYERGGFMNASLAIGFYFYTLPYIPLGAASNIAPGAPVPSYNDLLSKKRFGYRCGLIKEQADRVLRHPLQYEIGTARLPTRIQFGKDTAENWRQKTLLHHPADCQIMSAQELATAGMVLNHGGSSFGNVDKLYPEFYPISGDRPILRLVASGITLHCRPRELYLGASSGRGQLRINVFFDSNVYDEVLVREWLNEVKEAIQYYLLPKKFTSSHL